MASIPVTIVGSMTYTDLGVGGGPMPGGPPPMVSHPIWGTWGGAGQPGGPGWGSGYQPPLGIWGPPGPWPTPPIAGIPGLPGYQPPLTIWGPPTMPPGFWGGGMGPGVKPQPPGGSGEQPPGEIEDSWRWAWSPIYGWVVMPPGGGGKPQPPASSGGGGEGSGGGEEGSSGSPSL